MRVFKGRYIVLWILALVLLSASGFRKQDGFSPVENKEQLMLKLNKQAGTIETIQSNFIQKKQLEFLDETIISKGSFWFKKDNNLRWAYQDPFDYVIVIHQGQFSIRDGEQVSAYDIDSNPAFAEINKLIVDMVRGNITDERFEMVAFESNSQYLVKLVPKDETMKEAIATMEIYFSKSDLAVAEVIMKESEKDYTVITFIDKKI
ncbi:MAG: outer membrane lipoprotein carrier protein LolA, partial [Bacteroides sp.]|nr:outer membrane lipoprotein carrier protein LolA [Bacteroides sp.]